MVCTACGAGMNGGARFCSACGRAAQFESAAAFTPVRQRLTRPQEGRMIAGVCAGFAQSYGWDVSIVRLAVVIAILFGCGTPLIAYFVAWIVMPNAPYRLAQYTGPIAS